MRRWAIAIPVIIVVAVAGFKVWRDGAHAQDCKTYTSALRSSLDWGEWNPTPYRADQRLGDDEREMIEESLQPLADKLHSPGGLTLIDEALAKAIRNSAEDEWIGWARGYMTSALRSRGCPFVEPNGKPGSV